MSGHGPVFGAEQPQGPGWWLAADGRYYPPQLHPNYAALQAEAQAHAQAHAQAGPTHADPRRSRAGSRLTTWTGAEKINVVRLIVSGFFAFGGAGILYFAFADVGSPPERTFDMYHRPVLDVVASQFRATSSQAIHAVRREEERRGSVGRSDPVAPTSGHRVRHDDFTDPGRTWESTEFANGDSNADVDGAYEIHVGSGWRVVSLRADRSRQMLSSVTGGLADTPRAAMGAACLARDPSHEVSGWEFDVDRAGAWELHRMEDEALALVRSGQAPVAAPDGPITVRLACVMMFDERAIRLVGFVGDEVVVDVVQEAGDRADTFLPAVSLSGDGATARLTEFEMRDLVG